MKKNSKEQATKTLREKAELKLKGKMKRQLTGNTEADVQKLIHELEVHQIELEMHNEELLHTKELADQVIEKYTELYDFAPIGYFTLAEDGIILNCNLRGAEMLGTVRSLLINRSFHLFLSSEAKAIFTHFLNRIYDTQNEESCEIILSLRDKDPVYALISGIITRQEHSCLISVTDITERKKAQEELRKHRDNLELLVNERTRDLYESEDRYHTLFTSMTEGFCVIEVIFDKKEKPVDYRFVLTNPAFEKQSGLSGVEGKLISEVVPENEKYWFDIYGKIALTGEPVRFENKTKGLNRWFDITAYRVGGSESRKVAILFTDITENKIAERKLKESEEKFRAIFENNSSAIAIIEADTTISMVNNAYLEMGGYALENVIGTSWTKQIPQPDLDRLKEYNRRRLSHPEGVPSKYEFRFYKANGEIRNGLISVSLIQDLNKIVASFVDITERKHDEEQLRYHANLVEAVSDAIISTDSELRIQSWNRGAERTYGWRADEVIGKKGSDILRTEFNQEFTREQLISELIEKGKWQGELIQCTKDGRSIIVEATSMAFKDSPDSMKGIVSVSRNITERKKAEEELEQARITLAEAQKISHMGSFEFIASTGTTVWSEEEYRIYGLDPEGPSPAYEVMLQKCIHPEDAALLHDTFTKAVQDNSVYELEHRIVRPDGTVRWVYDRAYPYLNPEGHLIRYIGTSLDITERKKAEEALRESEENFRIIIETAGEGIVMAKPTGEFTFVNKQFQEILGYSAEELLGKSGFDFTSDEFKSRITPNREVLQKGKILTGEFKFIRKDGTEIITSFSASPVYDRDGNHIANFAMHTDITERRKAEEALLQSRSDLDRAQEVGSIGSWRLDTLKNILTWSDENHRIFGFPKETTLSYETFLSTIHPDDREYVDTRWNAGLKGEPYEIEHRIVVDGKIKWVREKAYLEFDENNQLLGGFGITQDITGIKQVENELRENEATLTAILNAATESIWLFSKEGIALMGNQTAFSRFKLPPEEIIGKSVYDILPRELADSRLRFLRETAETRNPIRFEDERDGIWFEHTFYPVIGSEKYVDRIVIFSRDITERKRAERELKQSHDKLEELVFERTAELLNINNLLRNEIRVRMQNEKALKNSQKQLRSLTQRVNEVAEGERTHIAREIHDELGHLLTVMKYDVEGLMNNPKFGEEPVKTDLESLMSMIESLIDTVRKIATELRPGILDHLGLIPAIEWQIKQFRRKTKICFHYNTYEPEITFSKNETTIIFRIFQEILTNILRHSGAKTVRISFGDVSGHFRLHVADDGIGFDIKKHDPAHALGLMGMKERALSIGGDVKIRSALGKGTKITFTLKKSKPEK